MKLLFVFALVFLYGCEPPDCPEHEKVEATYICVGIHDDVTMCEVVMVCPEEIDYGNN